MASLNVLLSHAVLDLTRDAERRLPAVNAVQWSDFWRLADGASRQTLHIDARISRRAIKTYVDEQAKAGTLTVTDGVVKLTERGRQVRDEGGRAIAEACSASEAQWRAPLRDALVKFVRGLELELPHYLHPYGTADPTITGGTAAGASYGADWKPVLRQKDQELSELSILALLSQALVAFAIEYELRGGPLLWAVNMASAFDAPMPLSDVPSALGVTGNGRSTVERYGFVNVSRGLAQLTPAGQEVKDSYGRLVVEVEAGWRSHHGGDVVGALRNALEAVASSVATAHAHHPVVQYVKGIGFAEVSSTLDTAAS